MAIPAERISETPEPERPDLRLIKSAGKKVEHSFGIDLAKYPAGRLGKALDNLGIGAHSNWEVANVVRNYARLYPETKQFALPPSHRLTYANAAFQNLIVGRIAERLFMSVCLNPLSEHGFTWQDDRHYGNSRDFTLTKDGAELPLNVKVATTKFRKAQNSVALDPDDCVPFPAYKVTNAVNRLPDLLYIDLIDFGLRDRVEHFMKKLSEDELIVWTMFTWYGGQGVTAAQDEFVDALFKKHNNGLMKLAASPPVFRVVSAKKILEVLREDLERCPQLTGKASLTAGRDASINLSISKETLPWSELFNQLTTGGIEGVLQTIRKTGRVTRPTPGL